MSMMILSSLLLAGAALPAADNAAIAARVREIFAPYSRQPEPKAVWDQHVFSTETTALIARWKRAMPNGEVDDLNDGDWFCLCQDWDRKKFSAVPGVTREIGPGTVEVPIRLDVGFDEPRDERLVFKREAAGWLLDDLFATEDFPSGLKQKLRETIQTDLAMRHKHQ